MCKPIKTTSNNHSKLMKTGNKPIGIINNPLLVIWHCCRIPQTIDNSYSSYLVPQFHWATTNHRDMLISANKNRKSFYPKYYIRSMETPTTALNLWWPRWNQNVFINLAVDAIWWIASDVAIGFADIHVDQWEGAAIDAYLCDACYFCIKFYIILSLF